MANGNDSSLDFGVACMTVEAEILLLSKKVVDTMLVRPSKGSAVNGVAARR